MKHSIINILTISVFLFLAAGCRGTVPIRNIENSPVTIAGNQDVSLNQVENAIKRAGTNLGWVMKQKGKGHIVGTLLLRKHVAEVDIIYDTKTFSINYKDSKELKYNDGKIHPNYNNWIANLQRDINIQLMQ